MLKQLDNIGDENPTRTGYLLHSSSCYFLAYQSLAMESRDLITLSVKTSTSAYRQKKNVRQYVLEI